MNLFVLSGVAVFAITCLILMRRAVEERVIRWRLYALRDDLRDLAYQHVEVRRSPLFRVLDSTVTFHCGTLIDASLWSVIPPLVWLGRADRLEREAMHLQLQRQLAQPQNAALSELYERSVRLMTKHLLLRHLFLTFAAAITVIGGVLLVTFFIWLARRIMSGSMTLGTVRSEPATAGPRVAVI